MSFLTDLLDRGRAIADTIFSSPALPRTARFLDAAEVDTNEAAAPVAANAAYVTIKLASLRIQRSRRGLDRLYAAVHARMTVLHQAGPDAVFQVLTTPTMLENLDRAGLAKVVQSDIPLLGPIAYRGGDIGAEFGLFSVRGTDMAAPFLATLNALSAAAGVAFVASAAVFAAPLQSGIRLLLGTEGEQALEVGFSGTLPGRTGWFAAVAADPAELPALLAETATGRLLDADSGAELQLPYLLLRITATPDRPDWFKIPAIADARAELEGALAAHPFQAARADDAMQAFRVAALTSKDLIRSHAQALVLAQKADFDDVVGGPALTALVARTKSLKPLSDYRIFA